MQRYPEQPLSRRLDENPRRAARGFAAIGLVNLKTPANIGSVMRAAGCYSASLVILSGTRPKRLQHIPTDTQSVWKYIPHILVDNIFDTIPYNCVPVAVDLLPRARNLINYVHPERAYYIFGAEDMTLGKAVTDRCRDVIYVPTNFCMNLAAAVNVILYDRLAKQENRK